ncbi:unnamed protein product [Trifolium pratense]|uniref:Uncharacterized protein n=1 Tax=Trifolium pratense TaxID=57577 RepID=A0ACB0KKS3_TRIPR|nr:unnamed protein product [Trifolium pratense]
MHSKPLDLNEDTTNMHSKPLDLKQRHSTSYIPQPNLINVLSIFSFIAIAIAMASLLLTSSLSPLSIQFNASSSHLSFSHSQTLHSPFITSSFTSLSVSSTSSLSPSTLFVYCGRGDRKTAKGKRFSHSFGNARPRNKNKGKGPPRIYTPPDPTKKEKLEDNEVLKIEINEDLSSD